MYFLNEMNGTVTDIFPIFGVWGAVGMGMGVEAVNIQAVD